MKASAARHKPRTGRPPLVPGGLRVVCVRIGRKHEHALGELATRLRTSKSGALRTAIEDLWAKVLTYGDAGG